MKGKLIRERDNLVKEGEIIYAACDPGLKGAVVAIDQDKNVLLKSVIPTTKDGSLYLQGVYDLFKEVKDLSNEGRIVFIVEDVHSIYGSSAKSNFTFGGVKMAKEMALTVLGVDYWLIPPMKWQKKVWVPEDDVFTKSKTGRKKRDTKATALNAANRLFPGVNLTKSARAYTPHDGIVDALLMAEYARLVDDED